ncbi:M24 family metallopeptidase [Brevibacillus laterosporus]|uniref:M24 family metallopeptidase n=1 Tax=Brevibacillus laterosporus TaxID=1465 RepID=UPI0003B21D6A|nr:Xaa-Pro peptidase family protein [Brevibacillus laterosporus]ERM15985.1 hypothetical protein P615_06755 [Brevibacillus laterosporus PE36]
MKSRTEHLYLYMEKEAIDVLLITLPKNVYYFTGFLTEPHERFMALVLIKDEDPFLFLPLIDSEKAQAVSSVTRIYSHRDSENPYEILQRYLPTSIMRLGLEKSHLSAVSYEAIRATIHATETLDIEILLRDMRMTKSPDEIATIKQAIWVIEESLRRTLPKISVGSTELDIVAELEFQTKKLGAQGPSFSTIVLGGQRTGLPHGEPTKRAIQEGELLLIDAGVFVGGYVSDLTRTFAVGKINHVLTDMYDTVLRANLRAIETVRPSVPIANVDLAAREIIENKGYGEYFINRVGHGIGLEIHEYPSVHSNAQGTLQEGMVFTIEPGIYNPRLGGVRIEDDVLVTASGAEVLTTFPKELITLEC